MPATLFLTSLSSPEWSMTLMTLKICYEHEFESRALIVEEESTTTRFLSCGVFPTA
jgi:hypothetical protein